MVNLQQQRKKNLSILAKASLQNINKYWSDVGISEAFSFLKKPEVGMAMVRAQAGSGGEHFNMGEMTMTRCVIKLDSDEIGYGFVSGRSKKKSELVALIDACWQKETFMNVVEEKIIKPLQEIQTKSERKTVESVKTSKVNFFTMVRGE